jgi:hypothetical protein
MHSREFLSYRAQPIMSLSPIFMRSIHRSLCISFVVVAVFCFFGAFPACAAGRIVTAESHASCDACRTLVERFTVGWEDVIREQAHGGKADQKQSTSPPAITYNQEIEDYLQGFCKSDYIAPPFSEDIRRGCSAIMDVHKREVVATFLSVTEQIGAHGKPTRGPTRLRRICEQLTSSCSQAYTNVSKLTKCEACVRVLSDAHFVLRRRVTPAHALSSIEATDVLDTLCSDSYRRYDDSPRLMEKVCEEMMDDHVMSVLKVWRVQLQSRRLARLLCPLACAVTQFQVAQAKELPEVETACAGVQVLPIIEYSRISQCLDCIINLWRCRLEVSLFVRAGMGFCKATAREL